MLSSDKLCYKNKGGKMRTEKEIMDRIEELKQLEEEFGTNLGMSGAIKHLKWVLS